VVASCGIMEAGPTPPPIICLTMIIVVVYTPYLQRVGIPKGRDMKRFFCTVCKKVKRVRKYPTNVVSVHADDVFARRGSCDKHDVVKSSYMKAHDVEPVELNMLRRAKRGA